MLGCVLASGSKKGSMPPKDNEGKAKPKIPSKGKEEKTSPHPGLDGLMAWLEGQKNIEKVETIGKQRRKTSQIHWENPAKSIECFQTNQPILGWWFQWVIRLALSERTGETIWKFLKNGSDSNPKP